MKKKILAIMFFLIFTSLLSLNAQWAITYGGSETDEAYSIQQTSDGGYIVVGTTWSYSIGDGDIWILKLSSTGAIEWQRYYGGGNYDYARCIKQTSDGGYIVGGSTFSFGAGEKESWILKLNSAGDIEWQHRYGGDKWDHVSSILQTDDGGYVIAGCTGSFGAGSVDFWILKLSSAGDIEWQETYGGSSEDKARSIQQTIDGGYIVAGWTNSFGDGDDDDIWILKLTSEGDIEWQKAYGDSGYDKAQSIQQTLDGGYIVAGWTNSFGDGSGDDVWILKLNAAGDIEWHKIYSGSFNDRARSIQQTIDGGYIVAGCGYSFSAGNDDDFWILKLTSEGDIEWQKKYGGNYSTEYAHAIQQTNDGGYVIAGTTRSWGAGEEDIWILKLSPSGEINPSCVFIRSTDALVSYPDIIPMDTNIIPMDTNIEPQDTNILPLDSDANVYKLGESDICTLTLSSSAGGTTSPAPGTHIYDTGTEVTLNATPDPESDYTFGEWSGNVQTDANPITITMDGDKTIDGDFYIPSEWGGGDGRDEYISDGYDGLGGRYDACFIATAAYGSKLHNYVKILRNFRDKYLMPSKIGRKIVDIYYKYSPFVADLIAKHKVLKIAVRISLLPMITFSYSMVRFGLIITAVMLVFIFVLPILSILIYQKKKRQVQARDLKALAS
jgi:uncharacterized delta-60 repeat protein